VQRPGTGKTDHVRNQVTNFQDFSYTGYTPAVLEKFTTPCQVYKQGLRKMYMGSFRDI
jgi:hypothetical protein